MSYSVSGTTITLTRGDTFRASISITDSDGNAYIPVEGDVVRFAAKQTYATAEPAIMINIPVDTMVLVIGHKDTTDLDFGTYVYDIELTKANGDVDTFIAGKLKLTEEVC